jgi:signal transduction histidine kinase
VDRPTSPSAGRWQVGPRVSWLITIAAPSRFDAVLVAIVIAVAEAEIWLPSGACIGGPFPFGLCNFGESLAPPLVAVVYTTISAIALLGRRQWPVQVLVLVAGLSILVSVIWVASPGLGYFLPILVGAYSVGRYHRGRHPWLALAGAAILLFATNIIHDLRVPGETASGSVATFYAVLIGALPMGRALQTRDLRADLAAAQAREARLAQAEAAHLAVEEERARIARELHDVAAHGTSLIVVQSVAAQGVFDSDREKVRSALEAIEAEARETLKEMRRLLADIRPSSDGDDPVHAAPETLESLVARVRAAGQPVEADIECAGGLGDRLELTVYRCVQEALTNAIKHAPGARTKVLVRCARERVEIDVENGRSERPSMRGEGGQGLAGMRERVTLLGGTLMAEPTEAGGFHLRLSIPAGQRP